MALTNTKDSYGSVAKFLHWTIFLLISGLLIVGFWMVGLPLAPDTFRIYDWHKSVGIIVLALVLLRLVWKMVNVAPALPASMQPIEKFLAHAGHAFLYVLIIAMPLSGWMMSSASGFTVSVFGVVTLPNLVNPDPDLKNTLAAVHEITAYLIIWMVSLHVLAALLHHFYHKDNVLRRMLPFTKR